MIHLPDEIWQLILKVLMDSSPQSFLRVAKMCPQWINISTRLCRKKCMSIERSYLQSLFDTRVSHQSIYKENEIREPDLSDEAWIDIYALNEQSRITEIINNFVPLDKLKNTLIFIADPLFITCSNVESNKPERVNTIRIFNSQSAFYSPNESTQLENVSTIFNNNYTKVEVPFKVLDIQVLIIGFPVMLIKMNDILVGFAANNRMKQTVHLSNSSQYSIQISGCDGVLSAQQTSTEFKYLLTLDIRDNGCHTLYEAGFDGGLDKIELKILYKFKLNYNLFSSKLFRRHIKSTERNGFIRIHRLSILERESKSSFQEFLDTSPLKPWCIKPFVQNPDSTVDVDRGEVDLVATSNFSKDLRYPNKTIFTNGWIIASTSISRSMLYYWHMDRGRENNWLVAQVSQFSCDNDPLKDIMNENFKLFSLTIGLDEGWRVTAVTEVRGLLICGTKSGFVIVYNVKNMIDRQVNDLKFIEENPILVLEVINRRIINIKCLCTSLGMLVGVLDDESSLTTVVLPLSEDS